MEKKKQHVIPECYLKAWCDPATPPGHTPYVWVHSRDGSSKRKRAPRKLFVESDFYTVKLEDGTRSLLIEDSFSVIEDRFVRLRSNIQEFVRLSDEDRGLLCVFTAMMCSRTKSQRENWTQFASELHGMTESMEQSYGAEPGTSKETARFKEYGHHMFMGHSIEVIADWLFRMNLVIFTAAERQLFLTSDRPGVWFNPDAHKMPPMYRGPGLAQEKIEITLPLSPKYFALFSWRRWNEKLSTPPEQVAAMGHCVPIVDDIVAELNRRTRGYCDDEFVTQNGETESIWFDMGEEPEDSWEKTHPSPSDLSATPV